MQDLTAVIGDNAARVLLQRYAGRSIYIPKAKGASWPSLVEDIAKLIGMPITERLCNAYGGTELYFPRYREVARKERDKQIQESFDCMTNTGKKAREAVAILAEAHQQTERNIWRILKLPV